jgi:hypothetical protein
LNFPNLKKVLLRRCILPIMFCTAWLDRRCLRSNASLCVLHQALPWFVNLFHRQDSERDVFLRKTFSGIADDEHVLEDFLCTWGTSEICALPVSCNVLISNHGLYVASTSIFSDRVLKVPFTQLMQISKVNVVGFLVKGVTIKYRDEKQIAQSVRYALVFAFLLLFYLQHPPSFST